MTIELLPKSKSELSESSFAIREHVVVAVPTLNEEASIEQVLRSLASEKHSIPLLEIIVADGGSKDRTVAIVEHLGREFPFIRLVANRKVIQSAGVNVVARGVYPTPDILVRCDAHAIYPERYIQKLVSTLNRTKADAVVVAMDSVGRTYFEKALAWVSDTPVGSGGSGHRGGRRSGFVDHGHHAAFRLATFLATGGYDETFRQNEDAEFDSRLNARGGRVYLDADIRIAYHPRANFRGLWRQYFSYGFGRSRTIRRHPHTIRLRQLAVPIHLVLLVASVLIALASKEWLFLAWPAIYVASLALTSLLLAAKNRALCALLAGPAACVMHTAWATGFFAGFALVREARWQPSIQSN